MGSVQRGDCFLSSPAFVSDWSIFMQIRNPNLHNLIGPNSTALIDPYEATLIGQ